MCVGGGTEDEIENENNVGEKRETRKDENRDREARANNEIGRG